MVVTVGDECEFTVLMSDFIITLSKTKKFELYIWINSNEIPLTMSDSCDFHFMTEGVRVCKPDNKILWIFYDTITAMEIKYES